MTPEQYARAKELFLAACARPPEGRADFLNEHCAADAELRDHVQNLLLHHSELPAERQATGEPAPSDADSDELTHGQFAPGVIVAQRYQVVSLLGRGGMGEVYLANDTVLNQRVALKFLPPRYAGDAQWVKRLVNEVRVARRVTNSVVCRVFDIEVGQDGPAFITMEYVNGESLSSLIRRIGRLPTAKALDIARQICTGLCAAHAAGLLHRDLKPSNIMIDGDGAVRIMDFGLAAPRDQISDTEIRSGTPAYMAPESTRQPAAAG
jgi:serine/threonine protein kinase